MNKIFIQNELAVYSQEKVWTKNTHLLIPKPAGVLQQFIYLYYRSYLKFI
jgi:hypothetical protein